MSSENYEIPWAEGYVPNMDISVSAVQGQLISASGILATMGLTGQDDGVRALYVLGASVESAGRKGVYQKCVVSTAAILLGTAGDPIYLGLAGDFTLDEPTYATASLKQQVGVVRADLRGQINLTGFAEVIPMWTDYVPTLVFTTGTPAAAAVTGRYREYSNRVEGEVTIVSADGNGATALTVTLPVNVLNNSSETAVNAQQLQNATWANPFGYIDHADSLIKFEAFTTCTDAQACEWKIKFVYEKTSRIITAWTAWTLDTTWTGTEPDSIVEGGRYYVENGTCHFEFTMSDADPGAAGTALTVACPVAAVNNSAETAVIAQELNNTTWLDPFCYVDQATSLIKFEAFGASADDEPFELKVTGSYEV